MTAIPLIDLNRDTPHDISRAMKELGFLAINSSDTPSREQIDNIFEISRRFFLEESLENKERVAITVENTGWVKMRQESLDSEGHTAGDTKEAFNIAKFAAAGKPSQPLPPLLERHLIELEAFMKSCHALGAKLLESFALDMGLATDFFTSKHKYDQQQSSVLRLLYYPPTNPNEFSSNTNMRAGSHSDYGTCTFLFQKDIGGLQILLPRTLSDPGPTWLDVPVIKDSILVNVGDLFDFWTGGKFKSTQHRVVAPRTAAEAQGRFSIAYFLHPADSERLVRIPLEGDTGLDAEDERSALRRFGIPADAELTAREWLLRRLGPTYSKRKAAHRQMDDVAA